MNAIAALFIVAFSLAGGLGLAGKVLQARDMAAAYAAPHAAVAAPDCHAAALLFCKGR